MDEEQVILGNVKKILDSTPPVQDKELRKALSASVPTAPPNPLEPTGVPFITDAKQLANEKVLKEFSDIVQAIIAQDNGEEALKCRDLLENILLPAAPELANHNPEVHRKYEQMVLQLKFVVLSTRPLPEVEELIRGHLVFVIKSGIFVKAKFQDVLDKYDDIILEGKIAETLDKAMLASVEKLGLVRLQLPGQTHEVVQSIANWLIDYQQFSVGVKGESRTRGPMERVSYINQSSNAKKLSSELKELLLKVLELHDWLRFGTNPLRIGLEDAPQVSPLERRPMFVPQAPVRPARPMQVAPVQSRTPVVPQVRPQGRTAIPAVPIPRPQQAAVERVKETAWPTTGRWEVGGGKLEEKKIGVVPGSPLKEEESRIENRGITSPKPSPHEERGQASQIGIPQIRQPSPLRSTGAPSPERGEGNKERTLPPPPRPPVERQNMESRIEDRGEIKKSIIQSSQPSPPRSTVVPSPERGEGNKEEAYSSTLAELRKAREEEQRLMTGQSYKEEARPGVVAGTPLKEQESRIKNQELRGETPGLPGAVSPIQKPDNNPPQPPLTLRGEEERERSLSHPLPRPGERSNAGTLPTPSSSPPYQGGERAGGFSINDALARAGEEDQGKLTGNLPKSQ